MGFSKAFIQCPSVVNLTITDIEDCAKSPLGTELQLKMENASSIIKVSTHVPTITFDHKYDAKAFFEALDDFYGVVEMKLADKN
jgi:hypothetical protein